MPSAETQYQPLTGTGRRRAVPIWSVAVLLFLFAIIFVVTEMPFEVFMWTGPPLLVVVAFFVFLFQGRRVQLWQGENHLLLVEWDFSREYYKRFRYADIQAITWRRTAERRVTTIVFAVIGLMLIACTLAPISKTLRVACAASAVLAGVMIGLNLRSGETCRCWIRTAVQTTELRSVTRLKQGRKIMETLRPRIFAAQGPLSPEELAIRFQEWSASTSSSANLGYMADDPNAPPRILT